MVNFPCKDCNKRHIGCHASCIDYIVAKNKNESYKKTKKLEHLANEIKFNSIFRACELRDKRKI